MALDPPSACALWFLSPSTALPRWRPCAYFLCPFLPLRSRLLLRSLYSVLCPLELRIRRLSPGFLALGSWAFSDPSFPTAFSRFLSRPCNPPSFLPFVAHGLSLLVGAPAAPSLVCAVVFPPLRLPSFIPRLGVSTLPSFIASHLACPALRAACPLEVSCSRVLAPLSSCSLRPGPLRRHFCRPLPLLLLRWPRAFCFPVLCSPCRFYGGPLPRLFGCCRYLVRLPSALCCLPWFFHVLGWACLAVSVAFLAAPPGPSELLFSPSGLSSLG